MPDDKLAHIHSEMTDNVHLTVPTDDADQWAQQFTDPAPTAPEDTTEAPEADTGTDDTTDATQAAQASPEADPEASDVRDRRIARLANDVREKNRKLAMQSQEIERLKGMRPESRDHELDRLADERAEQKVKVKEFVSACDSINKTGIATYGQDFRKAVDSLNDVCSDPIMLNGMLEGIIEAGGTTEGAAIIKHLGENVDLLEDIVAMAPHRQGAAIAKLAAKLAAPKTRAVSKAPAPIKAVSGNASTASGVDPMKMSMDEFAKWSRNRDIERGRIH